jgi:hypothetical protein
MKPVVPAPIPKKYRPKACVVTSYSCRFQHMLDLFAKKRFDGRTFADWICIPGGARELTKDRGRDFILGGIEESVQAHGAHKVILMITATEGETLEDSTQVLKNIKAIVEGRIGKTPIELYVIRGEGLFSIVS